MTIDSMGRDDSGGAAWQPAGEHRGGNWAMFGRETWYVAGLYLRRASVQDFLCADCHGASGLRRYQYFHSAVSRRR